MNITTPEHETPPFNGAAGFALRPQAETIFVEPLDSYMRLHGWDGVAMQRLDLLHIVVVGRATATVLLDGKADALSPGDVLIVPPEVSFGLSCDHSVEGYVVALSLDPANDLGLLSETVATSLDSGEAITLRAQSTRETINAFDRLYTEACGSCGELTLSVHAALCLAIDASLQRERPEPDSGGAAAVVAAFCALVERDFRQQRPLNDYCAALDTTERALRRATQKQTGQTPLQLVHARCVLEAMRLLRYTNVSVAMVGQSLGFDDPAYFNRFFKKAVGESPRAWRVSRGEC